MKKTTIVACVLWCLVSAPAADGQEDPWPQWQRTATRLGNTTVVGPKTPTIEWSVQFDPDFGDNAYDGSPVMDADGRIYLTVNFGLVAIDTNTRSTAWSFVIDQWGGHTPAYYQGRVMFGSPTFKFYCIDAETGQEVWSHSHANWPFWSPVVDNGIVYYMVGGTAELIARRISDGQLLWERDLGTSTNASPSLDLEGRVFSGDFVQSGAQAFDVTDGSPLWDAFISGFLHGTAPVLVDDGADGRVYVMDTGGRLYCFNRITGDEIWMVDLGNNSTGEVCVGHDGTLYAGANRRLFALTPDGDILWQLDFDQDGPGDSLYNPPIVDGDGTIYFTTFKTNGNIGRVHAVNPDGSVLWIKVMPDRVASSPMLGPDGTLYVNCSDTYLYAFKDPCRPDLNSDGTVNTQDFLLFLNAWADSDPLADWNNDGNINTIDFLGYLNDWAEGC